MLRVVLISQLVKKLQQTCQFFQVATSVLKSGLFQLVSCRFVTTCLKQLAESLWIASFYNHLEGKSIDNSWYKEPRCFQLVQKILSYLQSLKLCFLNHFQVYSWQHIYTSQHHCTSHHLSYMTCL